MHIFQKLEKDPEIPYPKLADRWKYAVWLGKSDLTDEHLIRTDPGFVYGRSFRRLAEHSWLEENLGAVVKTPQKPRSTTKDAPSHVPPPAAPGVHEDEDKNENEKEKPTDRPEDDDDVMHVVSREMPDTTTTTGTSGPCRIEKRTEVQGSTSAKKRLMTKSPKRLATPHNDPVKRRLTKKTDLKNMTWS